jgi:hypothetical protein
MTRYFTTGTDAAASLVPKRCNLPMIERTIEKLLFACRWLLACDVPGLVARAAQALAIKFQEAAHSLTGILTLG